MVAFGELEPRIPGRAGEESFFAGGKIIPADNS
jgi:hypothetical protein